MFIVDEAPYVQVVQEPKLTFDLKKMSQIYKNYTVNYHAGLSIIMGHPFGDEEFRKHIEKEQNAIKDFFKSHNLEDLLILYDPHYQVHATVIALAKQHDKEGNDQRLLKENELLISSKSNNLMNINFSASWIKRTPPFEIELGPDVLSEDHRMQTLRITDTGQIVMKGRAAKDRKLLAVIRTEFEKEAGIIHDYGKDDDEFFFVIGYLKPDPRLLEPSFRSALEKCIEARLSNIQLALKVDSVKFIMYQNYSLDKEACVWESKEFKLQEDLDLPQKNLVDTVKKIIEEKSLLIEQQTFQQAI